MAGDSVHDHAQLRMTTRAQKGILKPSKFKDGTVRYEKNFKFANFASTGEPQNTSALLKNLRSEFALKDLGELHYFVGIDVKKCMMVLC